MLHGSINHISITVADLANAMEFFGPLLEFLGYTVGAIAHDDRSDHDLSVNINEQNGTAVNIWQAEPELAVRSKSIIVVSYRAGAIWPETKRSQMSS